METGLFGKLPAAGDFVARGISAKVRQDVDRWLATHLVTIAAQAQHWPYGGVRAVVEGDGAPWALLIEPSEDAVGRTYPLVACAPLNSADRKAVDVWADAAWGALIMADETGAPADDVFHALKRVAPPAQASNPLCAPLLWWDGIREGGTTALLEKLRRVSSG